MRMNLCIPALLILAGCDSGPKPPAPVPPPPAPISASSEPKKPDPAPAAAAPAGETGSVAGTVKVEGAVKIVKEKIDPACAALHPEGLLSDAIVVDAQNNVQYAFVRVKAGLPGGVAYPIPAAPVLLDQVGCRYIPHVAGLMAGQSLLMRNSDKLTHNVHGLPFSNKEWNIAQTPGQEDQRALANPEVMIRVKCEIHPWMGAWVGVLDHPFFAVTDAAGKFEIKGLPPGKYTVEVWHERYKSLTADVEVKAKEAAATTFTLKEQKEK